MENHKKNLKRKHLDDHQIAFYVDFLITEGRITPSENILSHVENCISCKDKILDVFLSLKISRQTEPLPRYLYSKPAKTIKNIFQKPHMTIRRLAASFFILALLLTFYFSIIKKNSYPEKTNFDDKTTSTRSQFQNKKQKSESLPVEFKTLATNQNDEKAILGEKTSQNADFEINANLEIMINSQFRNETIKVSSPENKSLLSGEINFVWEPVTIRPLQLKILNNKNEILFEFNVKNNGFIFRESLSPGLYYWKLESQHDLLYVGKFFIKEKD